MRENKMKLSKPSLREIVKEVLSEIAVRSPSKFDEEGDEIIVQAMADDIMAFLEGLPNHQKAELLDSFMDILAQQDPELKA